MYVLFCVFCFIVLFCVLFMCNVLLPTCINPIAGNKYINKVVGSWNVAVVFIDSVFVRF